MLFKSIKIKKNSQARNAFILTVSMNLTTLLVVVKISSFECLFVCLFVAVVFVSCCSFCLLLLLLLLFLFVAGVFVFVCIISFSFCLLLLCLFVCLFVCLLACFNQFHLFSVFLRTLCFGCVAVAEMHASHDVIHVHGFFFEGGGGGVSHFRGEGGKISRPHF
jgi:hypothetical protein